MQENVGSLDRGVRSVLGPAVLALGVISARRRSRGRLPLGSIAAIVAGAMVTETVVTRVCPLNALFGIDTRPRRRARIGDARTEEGAPIKKKGEISVREAAELASDSR